MDKRRYQVIGNTYSCMALNAKTVSDCVCNYLAGGRKHVSEAVREEVEFLLKWATNAEIGSSLIREAYTVIVVDADKLREDRLKECDR